MDRIHQEQVGKVTRPRPCGAPHSHALQMVDAVGGAGASCTDDSCAFSQAPPGQNLGERRRRPVASRHPGVRGDTERVVGVELEEESAV
jgi:hypothetical protein